MNFRLTRDEYEAIKVIAWGQGDHISTWVTQAVRAALRAHQADQAG